MTKFLELRKFRTMSFAGFAGIVLSIVTVPAPGAAQEGHKGQIHIQKLCPKTTFTGAPGSYCTVSVSDVAAIPANANVYYDEPQAVPIGTLAFLDSKVVIYVGVGNWATGRCTVDFSTGLGLCTVYDGTGPLAGFSARINVRIDYSTGVTYWDGTYSFNPLRDR